MTVLPRQTNYETRLNRVVDYVYDHLEEEIGMDRLAEVACLSPFHWHRIYTAMRGETLASTVRRLRLHRAADRLANSEMSVAEIAERAGYGSSEAFGRAFRQAYGNAPAGYRANGSHAAFKAANRTGDATGFPVEVVVVREMRCAAVPHTGSYMQIDRAMGALFGGLAAQGLLTQDARMIGLYFDDPDAVPVEELRSMACSPIGPDAVLPPSLEETILRGGPYAKLRYKGPYADMKDAYRWLWGAWLPHSGYEPAESPVFEEYLNNPRDVQPTELATDIHLPLASAP
ncbi:AraC family transcriptional regulator [Mesorhizobium albiziae]|uniref:AraC family transcriptional regulator n=1 Tax=Neomesorhizobium albiziae TaxID=335020 RepID=A0A1I3YUS7_9HYPH|nr:AraC family transcriptional regulator [Mesorhizobium albiziae]GLS33268.1 AraC family transcriptional regulator [Mesorhizobium albiziae]SFK35563.1 AraC family transcriptional regulator [Mesorhizobium albiziae]